MPPLAAPDVVLPRRMAQLPETPLASHSRLTSARQVSTTNESQRPRNGSRLLRPRTTNLLVGGQQIHIVDDRLKLVGYRLARTHRGPGTREPFDVDSLMETVKVTTKTLFEDTHHQDPPQLHPRTSHGDCPAECAPPFWRVSSCEYRCWSQGVLLECPRDLWLEDPWSASCGFRN